MNLYKAVILIILLLPHTGLAQEIDCTTTVNDFELADCAQLEYESADKELNTQYKKAMLKLPSSKRLELKKAQRSWVHQLSKECTEENRESEGGTIWRAEIAWCLKEKTEKRTKIINEWVINQSALTHHSSGTPNGAP